MNEHDKTQPQGSRENDQEKDKLVIDSDDLGDEEPVAPPEPRAERLVIDSEDLAAPEPEQGAGERVSEPARSGRRRPFWFIGIGVLLVLLIILLIVWAQRTTFDVRCAHCGSLIRTEPCWKSEEQALKTRYANTYCDRCGEEEIEVSDHYYCQNPECHYHTEPYAVVPRKVKRNSGEKGKEDRKHYCCRECRFRTVHRAYFCTMCGKPYREIDTEVPRESSATDENIIEGICGVCAGPSRLPREPGGESATIGGEKAASPAAGREAKPALP